VKRIFKVLALALAMSASCYAQTQTPAYKIVERGRAFAFPADHGAHPEFRTEWWYVTGDVRTKSGENLGFQITFFRTKPNVDPRNPSAFAARQIIFAHAAVSDPKRGRLLHDQRAAREGFGIASAKIGDADIHLKDWSFRRLPSGAFEARVATSNFALNLILKPTQPILLQGDRGYSQKGPDAKSASYYYSMPHLQATGTLARGHVTTPVSGRAWLDREWSSSYLGGGGIGWDWTGLNFDDGSALMAFRIRDRAGRTHWAGGTFRLATGKVITLKPDDVTFSPVRYWRSKKTGALYPVEMRLSITLPARKMIIPLIPIFPDQELDARASGLPVYWEGLVRTKGGSGYLELTGYAAPLAM
jgi:predicted secreted hydrolase